MAENFKWQKLVWSLVIAGSLYLVCIVGFVHPHEILGIYPYLVIGWWINIIIGVPTLLLRLIKKLHRKSFTYILIGCSSLLMGGLDWWFLVKYSDMELQWILTGLAPLAIAVIILTDFLLQRD